MALYKDIRNYATPEALGLLILTIPGYFFYRDFVHDKVKAAVKRSTCCRKEEDYLETKFRADQIRPEQIFVGSHIYRTQRLNRVKAGYREVVDLVNKNLEEGDRCFKVTIGESDEKILNVIRRLLEKELKQDGYNAHVSGPTEIVSCINGSEENAKHNYFFEIDIS